MKGYAGLVALSVALAIGAAVFYQRTLRTEVSRAEALELISRTKRAFTTSHRPMLSFRLSELPQSRHGGTLLKPETALPRTHQFPYAEIISLYRYSQSCDPALIASVTARSLRKAVFWHRYVCEQSKLPERFFASPPLVHPSGKSFAALAFASGRADFRRPEWVRQHLDGFHVLELKQVREAGLELNPVLRFFSELNAVTVQAILQQKSLVLSSRRLVMREEGRVDFGNTPPFLVYPTAEWMDFLREAPLVIAEKSPDAFCLIEEGNVCWSVNRRRIESAAQLYLVLMIAAVILLALTVVWLLIRRIKNRADEERNRLFILQTLTHELRTPAATLQLCLEPFRRHFDRLPEEVQTDFIRMCDETQRLHRIIQASTQYLQSHSQRAPVHFYYTDIDSVNEYFETILEPYRDRIAITPLAPDQAFRIDRYWLGLCVTNLVENALRHGQPPVAVQVEADKGRLRVTVTDAGRTVSELGEMTQAFSRRSTGHGLGLGLTIVTRIVALMRGRLTFRAAPTRFSISLPLPAGEGRA